MDLCAFAHPQQNRKLVGASVLRASLEKLSDSCC